MTTRKQRAEAARVYMEAARLMEEEGRSSLGCCWAIDAIGGGEGYLPNGKHGKQMLSVYPEGMRGGWGDYPLNGGGSGARIIALCFMAAMVEAGDA